MLLLISDTNILLDWVAGGKPEVLFSLEASLAVPDILLAEELTDLASLFVQLGLRELALRPEAVARAVALTHHHRKPSRMDLLALALAEQEACPLLTGDRHLRAAAIAENVAVYGTVWLGERAVATNALVPVELRDVYRRMRATGRRLPWAEVDAQLRRWGLDGL